MAFIIELPAKYRTTAEELAIKLATEQDGTTLTEFVSVFLEHCPHIVRQVFLGRLRDYGDPIQVQVVNEWDEGDRLATVNVRGALASRLEAAYEEHGNTAKIRIIDPLT